MKIIILNTSEQVKNGINNFPAPNGIKPVFFTVEEFNRTDILSLNDCVILFYVSSDTITDYILFKKNTLKNLDSSIPVYIITLSLLEYELDQVIITSEYASESKVILLRDLFEFIKKSASGTDTRLINKT